MTIAQDDYKALIKKHRPKGGSGTGMGWVKKLSEALQKKIRASKTAADASVDTTISAGQRVGNAIRAATPDLYRGESTTKRQALLDNLESKENQEDELKAREDQRIGKALGKDLPKVKVDSPPKAIPAKRPETVLRGSDKEKRKYITANFTDRVKLKSPDIPRTKLIKAEKSLDPAKDDGLTEGDFGTRAGKNAIQGFFKDTFGIEDIEVDYSFPDSADRDTMKKGGKVTAKKKKKASYGKKYSMNRGGMASLRKPTRV